MCGGFAAQLLPEFVGAMGVPTRRPTLTKKLQETYVSLFSFSVSPSTTSFWGVGG